MKKLLILGMFAVAGLMMSSCCNDYDCLIEKYSKTNDPTEIAEISNKIMKLQSEGKPMTEAQQIALMNAMNGKTVPVPEMSYDD
ncbi:MAG: hypothetical protein IKP45_03980 [Bacteroidales bacterium]|nr:hypothetical protein [Bacteroidales bacterium]